MSNKKSIENYDTPPESDWTYCVKFVHYWLSKISVLLLSSLSSGVISEYAEYLYFKGLPKKRTDNAKNFETKPTLVSCNLADILYCRQAKNRLNYYVRHYTICDMQIKQHTKSKQVHWCWCNVSKLARNNNLSIQQFLEIHGFWFQKKNVQLKIAHCEVYTYILKGIFFSKALVYLEVTVM